MKTFFSPSNNNNNNNTKIGVKVGHKSLFLLARWYFHSEWISLFRDLRQQPFHWGKGEGGGSDATKEEQNDFLEFRLFWSCDLNFDDPLQREAAYLLERLL